MTKPMEQAGRLLKAKTFLTKPQRLGFGAKIGLTFCVIQFSAIAIAILPLSARLICWLVLCTLYISPDSYPAFSEHILVPLVILVCLFFLICVWVVPAALVLPIFLLNLWAYTWGLNVLDLMVRYSLTPETHTELLSDPGNAARAMIWPVFAVLISGWFALRQIGAWVGARRERRGQHPPAGDS
ncbi:MAG: hypothetical protein R3360_00235 [Alphaproteobacteria bacterium]|nr:hypothetical protein [Alphaproteobacteria bacterium]